MANAKSIVVVTHDGPFHADDVFAVNVMYNAFPLDTNIGLARTRDPERIKKADVVIDVGDIYDAKLSRFDHHQKDGAGVRDNGCPYSSFGLVWKEYGRQICSGYAGIDMEVDKNLVQVIDAADCGYGDAPKADALTNIISKFNLTWSRRARAQNPKEEEALEMEAFMAAVDFAGNILQNEITHSYANLQAKASVEKQAAEAIVILNFDAEGVMEHVTKSPEARFLIYPQGGIWMCQCVPPNMASPFDKRKALPEEWAGKRDQELAEVTKVADAVFCHRGQFICGAKTKEGAIFLARLAMRG